MKDLTEVYKEINGITNPDSNLKRDNGNVNGNTAMGRLLIFGAEAGKEFALEYKMPKYIADAHKNGDIYIHDLDLYGTSDTCLAEDTPLTLRLTDGTVKEVDFTFFSSYLTDQTSSKALVGDVEIKGRAGWTTVTDVSRRQRQPEELMFLLGLEGGRTLHLTESHRVPVMRSGEEVLVYARDIQKTDKLFASDNKTLLDIVQIEKSDYQGFVYDLGTKEHWFVADEVIVHNCTCLQIPLDRAFKNGFSTGHGHIRPPQTLRAAAALTAVVIQANQNEQHGGQSIPALDYYLAPYVKKSYDKYLDKYLKRGVKQAGAERYAQEDTQEECNQAMEALVHNLNTLHSRAGSQTPFSSLNLGTDTSREGRMVTKSLLKALWEGLGNGETPIFPITIFKVKEGVNYFPEDPNYDLFKEAMRVSAKRLFPNFEFLDAPYNLKTYKPGPDHEVATMGAVTGEDIITIKYLDQVETLPFAEAWEKYHDKENVLIYDRGNFVRIKTWINNPNANDWFDVYFANGRYLRMTADHPLPTKRGRIMCEDLRIGDDVEMSTPLPMGDRILTNVDEAFITRDELKSDFLTYNRKGQEAIFTEILERISFSFQPDGRYLLRPSSKKTALQYLLLLENLGYAAKLYCNKEANLEALQYSVGFNINKKRVVGEYAEVLAIEFVGDAGGRRYDVETESDRFDVSGLNSHNCRTRVVSSVFPESNGLVPGRGNLSFTSINLPRIALERMDIKDKQERIDSFFKRLDELCELCREQLLVRFEWQAKQKVENFPFLIGQKMYNNHLGRELGPKDEIREIIKHGTLSIGFIGLAETLVALIGQHHGESDEAQELGLKIVGRIRENCDRFSQEEHMNFTCLATPAESLCFKFLVKDKQKFGIIPRITDREYYTNSSHIPVYFPISAFRKIELEAPYHTLEGAGHICYVELSGDLSENLDAFEQVIRKMHDEDIGYGAVNHPVDYCEVCGYTGIIGDTCPQCGRKEYEWASKAALRKLRACGCSVSDIAWEHAY